MLEQGGQLLRIFVGEDDKYEGEPVYEWIIAQAHERGLMGATALRGLAGYGRDARMHTSKILRLSVGLPIVVEMVDSAEKIEAFLPVVECVLGVGLTTIESVRILLPGSASAE